MSMVIENEKELIKRLKKSANYTVAKLKDRINRALESYDIEKEMNDAVSKVEITRGILKSMLKLIKDTKDNVKKEENFDLNYVYGIARDFANLMYMMSKRDYDVRFSISDKISNTIYQNNANEEKIKEMNAYKDGFINILNFLEQSIIKILDDFDKKVAKAFDKMNKKSDEIDDFYKKHPKFFEELKKVFKDDAENFELKGKIMDKLKKEKIENPRFVPFPTGDRYPDSDDFGRAKFIHIFAEDPNTKAFLLRVLGGITTIGAFLDEQLLNKLDKIWSQIKRIKILSLLKESVKNERPKPFVETPVFKIKEFNENDLNDLRIDEFCSTSKLFDLKKLKSWDYEVKNSHKTLGEVLRDVENIVSDGNLVVAFFGFHWINNVWSTNLGDYIQEHEYNSGYALFKKEENTLKPIVFLVKDHNYRYSNDPPLYVINDLLKVVITDYAKSILKKMKKNMSIDDMGR